jgi:hypothetical protein
MLQTLLETGESKKSKASSLCYGINVPSSLRRLPVTGVGKESRKSESDLSDLS